MTLPQLPYGARGGWNGQDTILEPHASTALRLHELGHKILGHNPGKYTVEEYVNRELDAETFSYENREKPINYRVGISAVSGLKHDANMPAERAALVVTYYMLKRGIPVTKGNIAWLELHA
jgi:hypothetical protein